MIFRPNLLWFSVLCVQGLREANVERQVSIILDRGHNTSSMTGKIAWSTREVGVDRDVVIHTELSEEASVLVARLGRRPMGATGVGALQGAGSGRPRNETDAARAHLDDEGLLRKAAGEARAGARTGSLYADDRAREQQQRLAEVIGRMCGGDASRALAQEALGERAAAANGGERGAL